MSAPKGAGATAVAVEISLERHGGTRPSKSTKEKVHIVRTSPLFPQPAAGLLEQLFSNCALGSAHRWHELLMVQKLVLKRKDSLPRAELSELPDFVQSSSGFESKQAALAGPSLWHRSGHWATGPLIAEGRLSTRRIRQLPQRFVAGYLSRWH